MEPPESCARECIIERMPGCDAVLEFEVAAWFESCECGFDDGKGIMKARHEGTAVNVVKLLGEVPFCLRVMDFEFAV